jgi:hypothetical protein
VPAGVDPAGQAAPGAWVDPIDRNRVMARLRADGARVSVGDVDRYTVRVSAPEAPPIRSITPTRHGALRALSGGRKN